MSIIYPANPSATQSGMRVIAPLLSTQMWLVLPVAQRTPGGAVDHFVGELHLAAAQTHQPGDHLHRIAEADGGAVAALHVGDSEVVARVGNLHIGQAGSAHPRHPPGLEPDDVAGVVDDAHEIGFRKADNDVQHAGQVSRIVAHKGRSILSGLSRVHR
jgi:hypothetical protein